MKGEPFKMEREGYRPSRFRENLNLYGGLVLGAIAPTVILRYTVLRDTPAVPAWIMALSSNACPALPIAGAAAGFVEGWFGLRDLCRTRNEKLAERRERESTLAESE